MRGVVLFERLPRKLRPTVAGELLIPHVRHTLREQNLIRSRLIDLQGKRRGLVRIATINGLVPSVLPLVTWMRQHHPFVKLVVLAVSLDAVIGSVIAGEAELGLGYQLPPDPKLRTLVRVPSRVGAIMAPDHPRAGLRDISLADCLGFPMIVPAASITIGALLATAFERSAITMDTVIETNSIEMLRRAAMAGESRASDDLLSDLSRPLRTAAKRLLGRPRLAARRRVELCAESRVRGERRRPCPEPNAGPRAPELRPRHLNAGRAGSPACVVPIRATWLRTPDFAISQFP